MVGGLLLSGSTYAAGEKSGDWTINCEKNRCQAAQQLVAKNGQKSSKVLSATLLKVNKELVMELVVPLGVELRSGIVTRVDEQKEFHFPYVTCMQSGCASLIPVKGGLYQQMKAGKSMKIGFRPFRSAKTLVVDLSLKGFTKASNKVK